MMMSLANSETIWRLWCSSQDEEKGKALGQGLGHVEGHMWMYCFCLGIHRFTLAVLILKSDLIIRLEFLGQSCKGGFFLLMLCHRTDLLMFLIEGRHLTLFYCFCSSSLSCTLPAFAKHIWPGNMVDYALLTFNMLLCSDGLRPLPLVGFHS